MSSWVLVANSSVAHIYEGNKGTLVPRETFTHHQTRERPVGPREEEPILFARQLAHFLHQNRANFEKLHLIAAPAFLGLLRQEIKLTVTSEVAKDLTQHKAEEIRENLPPVI